MHTSLKCGTYNAECLAIPHMAYNLHFTSLNVNLGITVYNIQNMSKAINHKWVCWYFWLTVMYPPTGTIVSCTTITGKNRLWLVRYAYAIWPWRSRHTIQLLSRKVCHAILATVHNPDVWSYLVTGILCDLDTTHGSQVPVTVRCYIELWILPQTLILALYHLFASLVQAYSVTLNADRSKVSKGLHPKVRHLSASLPPEQRGSPITAFASANTAGWMCILSTVLHTQIIQQRCLGINRA